MKTKASLALKNLKITTNTYLHNLIQSARSIQDNYDDDILIIKEELLTKIANDYSLDINELKSRYLRKKKNKSKKNDDDTLGSLIDIDDDIDNKSEYEYTNSTIKSVNNTSEDKDILVKIQYDNNDYYIEPFENGNVYDNQKNIVGIYKDDQMELFIDIINNIKDNNIKEKEEKEEKEKNELLLLTSIQSITSIESIPSIIQTNQITDVNTDKQLSPINLISPPLPVKRKPGRVPKNKSVIPASDTIIKI